MSQVPDRIPYIASDQKVLIESETNRADYVQPSELYEVIQDEGELPNPEIPQTEQFYVGSQSTEPQDFDKGQIELSGGSIPSKVTDAKIFAYILGDETYDSSAKEHTIKNSSGLPETQTIQSVYKLPSSASQDDIIKTYIGSIPQSTTLNVNNEGQLEQTTEWVAHEATTTKSWVGESSKPDVEDSVYRYDDIQSNLTVFGDVDLGRVTDVEIDIDRSTFAEWFVRQNADGTNDEWLHSNSTYEASIETVIDTPRIAEEVLDNDGSTEFSVNLLFENAIGDTLDITLSGCQTTSGAGDIEAADGESISTSLELKFKSIEIVEVNSNRSESYLKSADVI